MNVYGQELKMHIRSTLLWMASLTILIIGFMALFPSFSMDSEALSLVLENYPEEMLKAFGMSGIDLSTAAGYFAMTFLYIQICIAIQASNHGFSILSLEERERTADFLFVKPVKRQTLILSKTAASLTSLLATNAVVFAVSFFSLEVFSGEKTYDKMLVIKMFIGMIVFQLFFLSVGMAVSMMLKKIRSVLPFSMGLSFGLYIISAFGSIVGEETLAYITPYKHFEPNYIVQNNNYDPAMVTISAAVIVVAFIASYVLYMKRNIHTAS